MNDYVFCCPNKLKTDSRLFCPVSAAVQTTWSKHAKFPENRNRSRPLQLFS
jgi:hypothetical protein